MTEARVSRGGDHGDDQRQSLNRVLRRAFVTGAAAKVVTAVLSLVAVSLSTRSLGAEAYGVVAVVAGLSGVFGFLDFGIGNALVSRLAASFADRDGGAARAAVSNSLASLAVVGVSILVIGVPVVLLTPSDLLFHASGVGAMSIRDSVLLYVVVTAVTLPFNVGPRMAVALQRGSLIGWVNLAAGVMTLGLVVTAVLLHLGVAFFVFCFVGVPAVANIALTWHMVRSAPTFARPDRAVVSRRGVAVLLKAGAPFFVLAVAGAVAYQTDILVVAYTLGAAAAAVTGVLNRIFASLTILFINGFQQLWASVAHAAAQGDTAWIERSFIRIGTASTTVYAVASLLAVVLGPFLIPYVFGRSIEVGSSVIVAFALWNTYNFVMTQASFLLNGLNKIWMQAIPALFMAMINLPLSIFLANRMGIVGPLYASLFTHALTVGWITVSLIVITFRANRSRSAETTSAN